MGLTMLRLLLLPVFLWLILTDAHAHDPGHDAGWLALAIFTVMALTDKLDGYLARRLHQTSKLGTILDPLADKLLVACSVILLSFDWVASARYRIPLPVVIVIYLGYLIVAFGTLLLITLTGGVSIVARPLGKLNTVLQLALVIATLLCINLGTPAGEPLRHLLVVLWYIIPLVAIATCTDYVVQGTRQFRAARRPG
jgi:CDP-diacylglycerol--glycerol-3-phosphate 3-phosphatidyltransferase